LSASACLSQSASISSRAESASSSAGASTTMATTAEATRISADVRRLDPSGEALPVKLEEFVNRQPGMPDNRPKGPRFQPFGSGDCQRAGLRLMK
ncbi:MAG: hypothetical protein WBF17_00085, partial [Phycisphaerae bacterium]